MLVVECDGFCSTAPLSDDSWWSLRAVHHYFKHDLPSCLSTVHLDTLNLALENDIVLINLSGTWCWCSMCVCVRVLGSLGASCVLRAALHE